VAFPREGDGGELNSTAQVSQGTIILHLDIITSLSTHFPFSDCICDKCVWS